jgi:hypothetical protein
VGGVAQSQATPPEAVSRKVARFFLVTVHRKCGVSLPVGVRRKDSADSRDEWNHQGGTQ